MTSKPSHATVVAYLALFVAIGGVAVATTTHVLLPRVALSAQTSAVMHRSSPATQSPRAVLPAGHSESGMFSAGGAGGTGGFIGAGITYPVPLATAIPDSRIVDVWGNSATHCPGVGKAQRGFLCLYEAERYDVSHGYGYSNNSGYFSSPSVGVVLYWKVSSGGDPYSGGEWTVTAA